jgi:hypothetical protein
MKQIKFVDIFTRDAQAGIILDSDDILCLKDAAIISKAEFDDLYEVIEEYDNWTDCSDYIFASNILAEN